MEVSSQTTPLRKRIIFVITKANWGGAQKNVYDLAVAARDANYEVLVACGTEGELIERLKSAGISIQMVPGLGRDISLSGDPKAFLFLCELFHTFKPDIVHAHSSKAGLLATLAARITGVQQIIFTAHGWAFNESRSWWQKIIFAFFHLITVWCTDLVICVSKAVRHDISWVPFVKNKLTVVYNGIQEIKLIPKNSAREQLAPLVTEKTWIGTLAELHHTKGLDIALRAFVSISKEFPDTKLIFIGEGQAREKLIVLAKELGIYERVYFCGHVSNASSLLLALDIFLFPSRSEALGYAALEAGRAGLPVIASCVGGIPEIIEDDVSGILVSAEDIKGFEESLRKLLTNSQLRATLGNNLAQKVHAEFSQEQMIQKTLLLYSEH
jgi:glycosyltransferase involved in cell wall biosynthesis